MALPESVTISDDTMREGLQIESADIPVSEKLRLLDALGETGAKVLTIGSFAHPKWTPQMACIDEIAEKFVPKPGIRYTAAVFNPKGMERASKYFPKLDLGGGGPPSFACHIEMCDSFSRRNYNRTQAEQIAGIEPNVKRAQQAGAEQASVVLGHPFGSNFEGPFSLDHRIEMMTLIVDKWHKGGIKINRVTLLDSMGWNMPHEVRDTILAIRERWPEVTKFHMHLHNTRGTTMASFYEALQLGVDLFSFCQQFIQFYLTAHTSQSRLGQLGGGKEIILHLNGRIGGIHNPEIDHRIDLHRDIIPRNDIL